MTSKAVGEEIRHDHTHITVHVTIPFPNSDAVPTAVVTSARHVGNHLVATGPLFAIAVLDMPYPLPGLDFKDLVLQMLETLREEVVKNPENIVWGSPGRKVKETLMPQPPSVEDPLW